MKIDEKCIFNEATRRLFNRNGVEGATMRMIAEEAGVSSNTIYLYDKSKEKIVWEYCHILKYKIPEFLEYLVQQKD